MPATYDDSKRIINYSDYLEKLMRRENLSSNNLDANNLAINDDFNCVAVSYYNNYYSDSYVDIPRIYYKGYKIYDSTTK